MRNGLVFLLIFVSAGSWSQIYRGIKELEPYVDQLEELNEGLRSDPREFSARYQQMLHLSELKQDSTLLSFLYVLQGSYHFYLNKRDSAIYYFQEASLIAHEIGNSQIEITADIRRVFCDEYDKTALELARRMEGNFLRAYEKNDTINMIYSLNGMGLFFDRMDSTSRSFKCHSWALYLAESSENRFEEAFILNNMGLMKLEMGSLDSAYADFIRGLSIARELKNDRLECHLMENLGYYYLERDSVEEARKEFLYVLNIGNERGLKDLSLSSLTNLASIEEREENFMGCDSLYRQALQIAKEERLLHAVSPVYLGLAQLEIQTGETQSALKMLDSSLAYAEFSSPLEIRLAYLQLKSSLLENEGDTKGALEVFKELANLRDSLNEVDNIASIAEMQLRFQDEQKEKKQLRERNKLLVRIADHETELAAFRQRIFILITVFVIIVAVGLIYYYRLKQHAEREFSHTMVNKLEEERGRIARDLHDGIGQSLIILKNKVSHADIGSLESKQQVDQGFGEIIEEIRAISRSLIPPELKRLGLRKAIENRMNEAAGAASVFVTTEIDDLDKLVIEDHQSLRIYRIIQELTTNTIKHSEATAIKLEAWLKDGVLTIVYQDNGKGLDREKWKSADNSVGLRSIVQRLNYLNGSLRIERPRRGFKVVMKIQLD